MSRKPDSFQDGRFKELEASDKLGCPVPITQEPVIPDFLESGRKNMHKETADEFHVRKRHDLDLVVIPVIPPHEADGMLIHGNNTIVVNSGFMGIPAQVFNDVGRLLERLLAVYHPFLSVKGINNGIKISFGVR